MSINLYLCHCIKFDFFDMERRGMYVCSAGYQKLDFKKFSNVFDYVDLIGFSNKLVFLMVGSIISFMPIIYKPVLRLQTCTIYYQFIRFALDNWQLRSKKYLFNNLRIILTSSFKHSEFMNLSICSSFSYSEPEICSERPFSGSCSTLYKQTFNLKKLSNLLTNYWAKFVDGLA